MDDEAGNASVVKDEVGSLTYSGTNYSDGGHRLLGDE